MLVGKASLSFLHLYQTQSLFATGYFWHLYVFFKTSKKYQTVHQNFKMLARKNLVSTCTKGGKGFLFSSFTTHSFFFTSAKVNFNEVTFDLSHNIRIVFVVVSFANLGNHSHPCEGR